MKCTKLGGALAVGAVALGSVALNCNLTIRRYTVKSAKHKGGKPMRLVMLSDLHSISYGKGQIELLRAVQWQAPDVILLCGDMIDDKRRFSNVRVLLEKLPQIAPCFFCAGNHEVWCAHPDRLFRWIESCGIAVLHSSVAQITVKGTKLRICGIADPSFWGTWMRKDYGSDSTYRKKLSIFRSLKNDRVNILLAHRPEFLKEYAAYPFDLVFCGHAHGGQWRLPRLCNGLYAPNQGILPKLAGGIYQCQSTIQIVGRGLVRDWKPRVFNPPELVVTDIISLP